MIALIESQKHDNRLHACPVDVRIYCARQSSVKDEGHDKAIAFHDWPGVLSILSTASPSSSILPAGSVTGRRSGLGFGDPNS